VAEVLRASRKALRAKDIAEALPGVGYVSRSKHLLTTIGSLLSRRPEFRRVARGKYRLQRRGSGKERGTKGKPKPRKRRA